MGNRSIGRETALQFLFSRELNAGSDGTESLFALRVAKENPFSGPDRHHEDMPEPPEPVNSDSNSIGIRNVMGSDSVRSILSGTSLPSLVKELGNILNKTSDKKLRKKLTKQLKLARDYSSNHSFVDNLVHGVLKHQAEIDARITAQLENFTLARLSTTDRNVLRLAVYEMFYCTDIPPIVAINEAIELSKKFGTEESGSFVNGVLDRLKDQLTRPLRD